MRGSNSRKKYVILEWATVIFVCTWLATFIVLGSLYGILKYTEPKERSDTIIGTIN